MALEVRPLDARAQIKLDGGLNENGNRVTKTKTLTRIKADAQDQDIFETAQAVASLYQYPVLGVKKIQEADMTME